MIKRQSFRIPCLAAAWTIAALALVLVVTGCGSGPSESESKMTSYSTGENKADTADLFTVPPENLSNIQVVAV